MMAKKQRSRDMEIEKNLRHGITPKARTRAVAQYIIAHNDKHIDELAELTDGLDKTASKLLLDAIGSYEVGNTLLKQLLDHLDQIRSQGSLSVSGHPLDQNMSAEASSRNILGRNVGNRVLDLSFHTVHIHKIGKYFFFLSGKLLFGLRQFCGFCRRIRFFGRGRLLRYCRLVV